MITVDTYKDQVVGVFGLGKSGIATIEALIRGSAKVVAWDDNEKNRKKLQEMDLDVRLRPVAKWPWEHLSIIALSPGVPLTHPTPHPVVREARNHCCPIIGDIELLYQAQPHATYVAITGTNGKSTTTVLVGHILKEAGVNVQVGGNIGTAALKLEPLSEGGVYVLELSSYQLDLLATASFDISLLLNVSPDHIDRHGSIDGYIAAKMHIFDRQTEYDTAIVAVDDAYTRGAIEDLQRSPAKLVTVTTTNENADIKLQNGIIHDAATNTTIDLNNIRNLQGRHNWQNAICAYQIARTLNVAPNVIKAALESFGGLEHRMEWVMEKDGVTYINDSKATNANATSHALASFDNIYWILGGVAKEGGIDSLTQYFPKIQRAYLIGEAEERFAETLGGQVMHSKCTTLDQAIAKATEDALGEKIHNAVVMLSPACASFDQYTSFEARGEHFKQLVHQLELAA